MKITTKSHYGLMAMVILAQHWGEGPVSIREIAREQRLSDSYMEQLIASLRKASLVESVRGAQGGYKLSRPPDQISMAEIFEVLEGPIMFTVCSGDRSKERSCTLESGCVSRHFWSEMYEHMFEFLSNKSLKDVACLKTDKTTLQG